MTQTTVPEYPIDVGDFARSIWAKKVLTLIRGFKLREEPEDVFGDVLEALVQKKYLDRWDPNKGAYSNWIYTFARNICLKKYKKSNSKGGKVIEKAKSLQPTSSEGQRGVVSEEQVSSLGGCSSDTGIFASQFFKHLEETQPLTSSITYTKTGYFDSRKSEEIRCNVSKELVGRTFVRDQVTMLKYLCKGYNTEEIAELLKTSLSFIRFRVQQIKKMSEEFQAIN